MNQVDWVGSASQAKPFKDIRNQRDRIAEQKAELCMQLGRLINKCPPQVLAGGVILTRAWKQARDKAASVAANSRSSVAELSIQLRNMQQYWEQA